MAAAALLKTARSLDQSGPETTASKLEHLWGALAATSADGSGGFYASEEVALRWILKNTNAGAEAETIRRWPLTWHILACLFRRIPLFTLAKTLAERRFITILQQTARDLDTRHPPKKGSCPTDDEDENRRKRKKWQTAQFDLDALRGTQQCLVSAAALFSALRVLLGRLEEAKTTATTAGLGTLHSSHDRIGAEQIKSFFCTSAADAMTLLVPLLRVCRLALTTDMGDVGDDGERGRIAGANANANAEASQPLEGQTTWIATFSTIWDLRLQSPADPPEVAINMTLEGCGMLRRLLDIPGDISPKQTAVGAEVRQRWAAGLQRFLTNNVVLPVRSAYLNYKDLKTLEIARDSLTGHESLYLVLFYLALRAPRMIAVGGGDGCATAATSRDNEHWLQAAFDAIQEPLYASATTSAEERNQILAGLLDMAARYDASPSRESLQDVCRSCALTGEQPTTTKKAKKAMKKAEKAVAEAKQIAATDWRLVASVARCDADAFLVSAAGEKLLDDLVQNLASFPPAPSDCPSVSAFLVSLAEGSAKARSLPAFITRWRAGIRQGAGGSSQSVWLGKDIRTAVADALQTSLTKKQLLELLDQADQPSEKKSEGTDTTDATSAVVCKLVVFDAISAGIRFEEFEDAVGSKMVDAVAGADLPSDLAPEILAIRWRLIRRTLGWLNSVTAEGIWTTVQASLKHVAKEKGEKGEKGKKGEKSKKGDKGGKGGKGGKAGLNELTFEALACAFAFWMALKRSGTAEQEARDTTWALFGQFQGELAGLTDDDDKAELLRVLTRRVAAYDETADLFGGSFDSRAATLATYLAWMFCGSSRFIDEMTKSSKEPAAIINALSPWQSGYAGTQASSALVSSSLAGFQNEKATAIMTEKHIEHLEEASSSRGQQWHGAAGGLLRTPVYVLPRRLRERIVSALLPQGKPASDQVHLTVGEAVIVLDLLIRVTRERTVGDMDFDRLIWLGSAVEATARSATLQSALGLLDRYRHVATSALKHSLVDSESRDGRHRQAVLARISSWDGGESTASDAPSVILQMVLLQAALLAVENIPTSRLGSAHIVPAQERLAALIVEQLRQSLEETEDTEDTKMTGVEEASSPTDEQTTMLPLLFTFDAAMAAGRQQDMQAQLQKQGLESSMAQKMKTTADRLCSQKHKIGWKWKALIARYLRSEDEPRREVRFQGLFVDGARGDSSLDESDEKDDDVAWTAASVLVDSDLLRDYLEGETRGYSQESLLSYIQELVAALDSEPTPIGQLLAIQHLLGRLFEMSGAATAQTDSGFDLGAVHNSMAQRLPRVSTVTEAKLLAQTLRTLLLDDKAAAAAMKQWNIDITLSAVALAVALDGEPGSDGKDESKDNSIVRASPVTYEGACSLVEAVLKRHRLRLEGRFHLVVATLQALLSRLVAGQQESLYKGGAARAESSPENWIPLAKRFSRLLELVCEPSTAAVATMARRGAGSGAAAAPPMLHSATDAAKRSAGQHMYLVLMAYIKLQIDGAVVARGVREALEPGLFSILGITSDETRRLLNDAVDAGGRALFRDLYRRWLQFGKWKGV